MSRICHSNTVIINRNTLGQIALFLTERGWENGNLPGFEIYFDMGIFEMQSIHYGYIIMSDSFIMGII